MKPQPYSERNRLLRALGFKSYSLYLASALWQRIRALVLAKQGKCAACGRRASEVHHLDYDEATLRGESTENLVGLCWLHHRSIEFTDDGQKRHLVAANAMLRKLLQIGPEFQPRLDEDWRQSKARVADASYYQKKLEAGLLSRPSARRRGVWPPQRDTGFRTAERRLSKGRP
jgi:hypothetical protein